MARIAGVDLPPNKRVEIGLTYILRDRPHAVGKDSERGGNQFRYKGS